MELERQVQEKARAKAAEREARIARERQEELEAAAYNPWGRGGGGAPLRDPTGGVITELRGRRTQTDQVTLNFAIFLAQAHVVLDNFFRAQTNQNGKP